MNRLVVRCARLPVVADITASVLLARLDEWRGGTHAPAYRQLADAIRSAIVDGRIGLGDRLPAERTLAAALGVGRNTVTAAYDRLRDAGYAEGRPGAGTFATIGGGRGAVGRTGVAPGGEVADDGPAGGGSVAAALPAGGWSVTPRSGIVEFSHAAPPANASVVLDAVRAATEALPAHLGGHGYEPFGLPSLRAAIAASYERRGWPTTPDMIMVTDGAHQAHSFILGLVARPGAGVLVDHPTYPPALDAIRRAGLRVTAVPLEGGRWDVGATADAIARAQPVMAFLMPDFQNPTGALMDADTRRELSALLAQRRVLAVVDETHAWLPLDGQPMPPPFGCGGPVDAVLSIGSASKAFWGGLRIGWIRGSQAAIRTLVARRAALDAGTPVFEQLMAAHLIDAADGALAARRAGLRERRDTLAGALTERLPQWRFDLPSGGCSLWVDLGEPVSGALANAAWDVGIRLTPGQRFAARGRLDRRLRLPYTLPTETLEASVARLEVLMDRLARQPRGRSGRGRDTGAAVAPPVV